MSKNFFLATTIVAIVFTGLMMMIPISFGVSYVHAQQQEQQQEQPSSAPDDQRPPGYDRGPRFPVPFDQPPSMQGGNFSFGPIASIQNNETGQPAWLVVGFWRGNLLSFNETTATATTAATGAANATTSQDSDGSTPSLAVFNADFRMIMLNGSAPHTHVVTNFILSNVSSNENGTTTYTGSSTVSLREGPLIGVPTTIKLSGELISIFPDPSSVDGHFGDTPIYAAISNGHENNNRGPPPNPTGGQQ
jgi:hypothetical protein